MTPLQVTAEAASSPPALAQRPEARRLAALLTHLAELCGTPLSPAAAQQAVLATGSGAEMLEWAIAAAERCGLIMTPMRAPLAEALWRARREQPICAWSEKSQRWLVLERNGFFGALVSDPERPDQEPGQQSRQQLAEHLGLQHPKEVLEVGMVQLRQQAGGLGAPDGATAWHGPHLHEHGESALTPIARLQGFLRPERRDLATILIFSAVTGFLYMALPVAVNAFVTNLAFGAQSGPFLQALLFLTLALLACLALSAIVRGLQHYVVEIIQRRLFVRLATDLAQRLPRVKASAWDGVHGPEMVNRFLDVVTVQKSTALLLLSGINAVLGACIGLVVLAFYHPFLLAFALGILIALAVIVFGLGRRAISTSIAESYAKYEVVNWLEELVRRPVIFKGPGGHALAVSQAEALTRGYLGARRGHFRVLFRQIVGLLLLEVAASVALLGAGGLLVLNHQLTLGQLVASELIMAVVVSSVAKLGKQFEAWYDALAAVDKLGHLIDLPCDEEGGEAPEPSARGLSVEIRALSFARKSQAAPLQIAEERLAAGERIALQGASGSGRSMLLELLAGQHLPSAGFLALDDLEVRAWDRGAWREQVLLLRAGDIVQGTIIENVRLGRTEISLRQVHRALAAVKLLHVMTSWPEGLHTPLVTGGGGLPASLVARLLVARALALQPRLLLLDEVFENLPAEDLSECLTPILASDQPWTVVIVTRREEVTSRCGRSIVLPPMSATHYV